MSPARPSERSRGAVSPARPSERSRGAVSPARPSERLRGAVSPARRQLPHWNHWNRVRELCGLVEVKVTGYSLLINYS